MGCAARIVNHYPRRVCMVDRHGIDAPESAVRKVRKLYAELGPSTEPLQIAPDIWASGRAVGGHEDNTADGKVTYGVVLIADGYDPRVYYGTGNNGRDYAAPPGSVYVIDAREYHSLDYSIGRDGLLAFLAWDLPYDFTLQGFARRALRRLNRWGDEKQPFSQPGAGI